jgi:hypothetical protein
MVIITKNEKLGIIGGSIAGISALVIYLLVKGKKKDDASGDTETNPTIPTPPTPTASSNGKVSLVTESVTHKRGAWWVGYTTSSGLKLHVDFPWSVGSTITMFDLENFLYQYANGADIMAFYQSPDTDYLENIGGNKFLISGYRIIADSDFTA